MATQEHPTEWRAVILSRKEEIAIPRIEEEMRDYGIEIYSPSYEATVFRQRLNRYITKEYRMLPRIILVRFDGNKKYPWVQLLDLFCVAYILKGPKITEEEIENLRAKEEEFNQHKDRLIIDFDVGSHVQIIAGPMAGRTGEVESINTNRKTATIKIQLFGRATSVEVSVDVVELV